ncbi:MAG: HD domain-containing protein [Candidatus Bilamarchaeaceae archaeon]
MLTPAQKKEILSFAEKRLASNDPYHRLAHVGETAEIAVRLAKTEGADADACWAAAMLHDICKSKPGDHGTEGAKRAKEFLISIGLPAEFVSKVEDAIHFHNKEFHDGPKERAILWDSDKLPIMTPDGFRNRMLPFWVMRLGPEEGKKKAVYEYYFYYERFHTETAKKEIVKYRKKIEKEVFPGL